MLIVDHEIIMTENRLIS